MGAVVDDRFGADDHGASRRRAGGGRRGRVRALPADGGAGARLRRGAGRAVRARPRRTTTSRPTARAVEGIARAAHDLRGRLASLEANPLLVGPPRRGGRRRARGSASRVIFGLVAAVGWGLADYLGALAGRRMGSIATVVVGQALSAAFMTVVFVVAGASIGRLHGTAVAGGAQRRVHRGRVRARTTAPWNSGRWRWCRRSGPPYAVAGDRARDRSCCTNVHATVALVGAAVTLVGVMLVSTDLRALRAGIQGASCRPAVGHRVGAGLRRGGVPAGLRVDRARDGSWGCGARAWRRSSCYVPLVIARPKEMRRVWTAGRVALTLALAAGAADILGVTTYSFGAEHGAPQHRAGRQRRVPVDRRGAVVPLPARAAGAEPVRGDRPRGGADCCCWGSAEAPPVRPRWR